MGVFNLWDFYYFSKVAPNIVLLKTYLPEHYGKVYKAKTVELYKVLQFSIKP